MGTGQAVVESRGGELQQPHGGCCHCLVCGKLAHSLAVASSELCVEKLEGEIGGEEGEKDWMG